MSPMRTTDSSSSAGRLGRRSFLGMAAAAPLAAQTARDWTNGVPARYPDADVIVVQPSFAKYQTL